MNELVGARTAAAADSALAGLTGGIGAAVHSLRLSALTLLAELEVWAVVCESMSMSAVDGVAYLCDADCSWSPLVLLRCCDVLLQHSDLLCCC